MRNITDDRQYVHTMVLPQVLMTQILRAAHDELGHNSCTGTYMIVCRLYYLERHGVLKSTLKNVSHVRKETYRWSIMLSYTFVL